ncbi:MAG: hypothetical protein R2724_10785 [Bryobacterales bacterium]
MKNMSRKSIGIALLACVGVLGAEELSEGAKQYRDHRFAEAEKSLQQQVNEHSEDAEAQALLGRDLIALKKIDEGEAAIRKAQEMGLPEDEVLVGMATAAIERRDVGKAMELLNKAVEINPESADALHYRGLVKAQQKDFQVRSRISKSPRSSNRNGLYALLSGCRL